MENSKNEKSQFAFVNDWHNSFIQEIELKKSEKNDFFKRLVIVGIGIGIAIIAYCIIAIPKSI